jgi:3-hydroxybutyryl-CoA dehydratase
MSESDNVLGIKVGHKVSFSKSVTDQDIQDFARVSGDTQKLHLDEEYASKTRFKGRIAHGMLAASYISAALGLKLAPDLTVVYLSQQMRFQRPVKIGDTVTVNCEVTALQPERRFVTVKTDCVNQAGEEVVTGEALVLLDEYRP